ncbi:MAG: serine/threonine-protein kinase [Gemmataceae bacterium]
MRSRTGLSLPPSSPEQLLSALQTARLLPRRRLDWLTRQISKRSAVPHIWAGRLLDKGWLTKFQAQQILAGRGPCLLLGPYQVLEPLGAGGMGHVFKARHRWMKRVIALKILAGNPFVICPPTLCPGEGFELFPTLPPGRNKQTGLHIDCLRREAQAAAKLTHPHIVTTYDAGRVGALYFLAMEYIAGIDLDRLVRRTGPLPVALACSFIRQAALGLQYLHECGLVHRDIKPTNLLLAGVEIDVDEPLPQTAWQGVVKILDLGLARKREDGGQAGHLAGTPDFLPPEVAHDSRVADIRSDLYSLGCTFYFLLTGQVPYPGGSWTEKLLRHHLDPLTSPEILRPEIPLPVVAILQKLIAKDPAKRYQIPSEVAEALYKGSEGRFDTVVDQITAENSTTNISPSRNEKLEEIGPLEHAPQTQSEARPVLALKRKPGRFLMQVSLAIVFGMGMGWTVRHHERVIRWADWTEPKVITEHAADAPAPPAPKEAVLPFVVQRSGAAFGTLAEAIAMAQDGDTVRIEARPNLTSGPVDLRGKALTIMAASDVRPILHFEPPKDAQARQALFTADCPLTLQGLELVLPSVPEQSLTAPTAHLIYCDDTSLQINGCLLRAPRGHSPVVCRNCSEVKMLDSEITAEGSALSVEVGEASQVAVSLDRCRVTATEPDAAGLVFWAKEVSRPMQVRLSLEHNRIQAGRVVSFSGLTASLAVHAYRNEFVFERAVLSYAGYREKTAWRNTAWQGRDNAFQGTSDWMCVDGEPVGVRGLAAWEAWWGQAEQGSLE